MTDVMRIDSEDLKLVMKDTGGPIVRIYARGWMELHDLENLYLFVKEAIQRRQPAQETCPGEHEDPDFKREDGTCTICSP